MAAKKKRPRGSAPPRGRSRSKKIKLPKLTNKQQQFYQKNVKYYPKGKSKAAKKLSASVRKSLQTYKKNRAQEIAKKIPHATKKQIQAHVVAEIKWGERVKYDRKVKRYRDKLSGKYIGKKDVVIIRAKARKEFYIQKVVSEGIVKTRKEAVKWVNYALSQKGEAYLIAMLYPKERSRTT